MTRPIIQYFMNFSVEFQQKKTKRKNHGLQTRAIVSKNFMDRWQIDLMDFQSLKDGEYCWICNVQDHFTKFLWLKALKQKCAVEVVSDLTIKWPLMRIVFGRPRHPQSQGSVERANGDVQNILGSWMRTNGSLEWTKGI